MSPETQAEREQVAREFVETVLAREVCLSDGECTIVQQAARELLSAQRAAGLEEAQGIVESEEELPGDMPEEMFQAITGGDRAIAAETLRAVVRATKKSITSRLKEQRP